MKEKIISIVLDRRPRDVAKVKAILQRSIVTFIMLCAGGYFLAPDPDQLTGALGALLKKRSALTGELSCLRQEHEEARGINILPLESLEAFFIARGIGAALKAVQVEQGYMDVSVPVKAFDAEPVTPPMIAGKINLCREAFRQSCGILAIWPDIVLRVYTKPPQKKQ